MVDTNYTDLDLYSNSPATIGKQDQITYTLRQLLAGQAATQGSFTMIDEGRTPCVLGQVQIDFNDGCDYFEFWLDTGASNVHISSSGISTAASPRYEPASGRVTIQLAQTTDFIIVYFDAGVLNLNWRAGV